MPPAPADRRTQRIVELAAALADDFAIRADEHDRDNTFPFENFERLKAENYTSLTIAEELGGLGGTLLDFCLAQERLAQGCASTALAVNMHLFAVGSMMEGMDPTDMRGKLMAGMLAQQHLIIGGGFTEAEIGGNWGFPTTTAVRQERDGLMGFVLNGRKTFTSMSPIIDLFAVNTSTTDDAGEPSIGLFIVPRATPGIEIIETWDAMSMRATASHDMTLTDCWVPEAACVMTRQPGDTDAGANVILAWFDCSVASVYLGIATAARNFGVQFRVADMEIELAAAKALVRDTARQWMAGGLRERDDLARIVLAKYHATNAAVRVVDQAMTVVGAPGIYRRHPLQRYYRDVRPGAFHPMTNDVALELIGKTALGIAPEFVPRWG